MNNIKTMSNEADLAIKKANSFIAYRQRSISEVENKLLLSFNENVVKNVICNLKEQGILNDLRFAKLWVTSRCLSNQKSTQYIKYELKQKGISDENIEVALSEVDNDENAYNAGAKKIKALTNLPKEISEKKLESFLRRKGFNLSTTKSTIKKLLEENE